MHDVHKECGLVDIPFMTERLSASIGGHILNLRNLDLADKTPRKAMYDSGELENHRLHVCILAPSGFGKSTEIRLALAQRTGILNATEYFKTSVRTTFSKESWMGTQTIDKDGNPKGHAGVFEKCKRDIIGADEFMRFIGMMQEHAVNEYSNEEAYLLTCLQHDQATKDLSSGSIPINNIGTTMWVGSRIASIDMRHGLARRMLFQIFIPTPSICKVYREKQRSASKKKPISPQAKQDMSIAIARVVDDLNDVDSIDYTNFYAWAEKNHPEMPHFDVTLLKRIAVGYTVSRNTLPDIVMDEGMEALLQDEINSRQMIRGRPEFEIITRTLEEVGEWSSAKLKNYLMNWYQFTEDYTYHLLRQCGSRRLIQSKKDANGKLRYSLPRKHKRLVK